MKRSTTRPGTVMAVRMLAAAIAVGGASLLALPAMAQPAPGADNDNRSDQPADNARHDPTRPGPDLRHLLGANGSRASQAVPDIRLKARVIRDGRPATVLLEVDGRLVLLREGSELTLTTDNGNLQTLRATAVTDDEVRLHLMPLDRTIVIR
ncbi:MAG: hypothetical protein AB7S36_16975 [Planctomycetota bacterium]